MRIARFVLTWVMRLPARFTTLVVLLLFLYLVLVSRFVGPERVTALTGYVLELGGLSDAATSWPLIELGTVGIVVLRHQTLEGASG